MQATSSHVTTTTAITNSAFMADAIEDQPDGNILPILTQAAAASKRSHLLVRRRKRATRRDVR